MKLSSASYRNCSTFGPLCVVVAVQLLVVYMLWGSSQSHTHTHAHSGGTHAAGEPPWLQRTSFSSLLYSASTALGLQGSSGDGTGEILGKFRQRSHLRLPYTSTHNTIYIPSEVLAGANASALRAEERERRDPWLTKQRCYMSQDEAEMCVYEGPICLRPNTYTFSVSKKHAKTHVEGGEKEHALRGDDERGWCFDYRYFERVDQCAYGGPFRRRNLQQPVYEDAIGHAYSGKVETIAAINRAWGPALRTLRTAEATKEQLVRATSPEDLAAMPADWQTAADEVLMASLREAPSEEQKGFPTPRRVTWLNGSMYVAPLQSGWLDHIWHFATATFGLYDAKRQNATAPHDGFDYNIGGQWALPPMDNIVFPDDANRKVTNVEGLGGWQKAIMPLLRQSHTKMIFSGNLQADFAFSDTEWVCARGGVAIGVKPDVFTGHADAYAFRLQAYTLAGVTRLAHDDRPPARITILHRPGTRSILNFDEVEATVKESGLPYEVITNMGSKTWAEQVETMANTGILIASHGGALMNVVFMPMHSVVIEAFPYLMAFDMYKRLADAAGLKYYRLHSAKPSPIPRTEPNNGAYFLFEEQGFVEECEDPAHESAIDAGLKYHCNSRSKSTSITVDIHALRYALQAALDEIGCRDSICKQNVYHPSGWLEGHKFVNMKTGGVKYWPPRAAEADKANNANKAA